MNARQRSELMARVRQKDTDIELRLRSALHVKGLRYRKHVTSLPGTPDIVFTRTRVVVFVDGDFWHGYDFDSWSAKLSPQWRAKIKRNIDRDASNAEMLKREGWLVLRYWGHQILDDVDGVAADVLTAVKARRS